MDGDRELLGALSSEDAERALEQILHKHGPMVMGVCRRVVGDYHEAEDAFQATFIVLVRRRRSLALTKSLGGWLHGVAFRTAMKAKAMRSKQPTVSQLPEGDLPLREEKPKRDVEWEEIGRILDDEIQRLPEIMRATVVLCDLEGYSHKVAAAELGISPGTLSGRLIRARQTLRLRLTRRGVAITTAGFAAAISRNAAAIALAPNQTGGALQTATTVLNGKSASLTTAATLALVLANAASRNMFLARTLAASAKVVVVLVALVALSVFLMSRTSDANVSVAPYVDPLFAAKGVVMHLGDEAFRHRSGASRIAYSADGKMLVTLSPYSPDGGIYLWDAATGRKLREFHVTNSRTSLPRCLAISPSGKMIGIGQHNGEISVLDAKTGVLAFVERPDDRPVTTITFSPDGKRLITANMDGEVRVSMPNNFAQTLWERVVIPAKPSSVKSGHDANASAIAVSPDGTRLALADGAAGTIYVLDANSGDRLQTIEQAHSLPLWAHAPSIQTLEFIDGGRQLISGGHQTVLRANTTINSDNDRAQLLEVRLWDVLTGALVRDLVDVEIQGYGCLVVSNDGKNFVTNDDNALHFWRVGDGVPKFEVPIPGYSLSGVAYSPVGSTVAVPTEKGITFWNGQTGDRKFHAEKPRYSELHCVSWGERGDVLAFGYQNGVELRSAVTGKLQHRFELSDPGVEYVYPPSASQVAISADAQLVACAGIFKSVELQLFGFVRAWDTTSGSVRVNVPFGRPLSSMALADDASVFAVTTSYSWHHDTQLRVYELPSGKLISRFPDDFEVMPGEELPGLPAVKASQIVTGSTKIIVVCEDGYCFRWDYELHQKSAEFFANQRTDENACEVRTAVFSRDGKTLVTSGRHKLCVWNTETGALEHMELVPMSEQWLNLGISRDGRFLAGAESYVDVYRLDDTIRIWDLPSRTLRSMWKVPNARSTSLAFSPDNTKLLTGLDRGTAAIWDVRRSNQEPSE